MFFEPNQGQSDPQVKFLARGSGYGVFLTANEAVLELQHSAVSTHDSRSGSDFAARSSKLAARSSQIETSIIRMHLEGSNPAAKVIGSDLLPGKSNYFVGNDPAKWRQSIPQYARVNYKAVYPGVDLVYYGNQGHLEYDFRVAPGADPNQIALKFDGASARLENGDLVLSARAGDVRFHAPSIYQKNGQARRTIEGGFRQLANNKIGFAIGAYDHSRELVIDPTLFYSTFLGEGGGSIGESNVRVAVDSGFNIIVAGSTTSSNFPTVNPIKCPPDNCGTLNGTQNLFISKINPSAAGASQLVFSTYLGGNGSDTAAGVAVDNSGSIYVAGSTTSSNFPTTTNAFQQSPPAVTGTHGFLSKLSLLVGSYSLNYSTLLAGNLLNGNPGDIVTGLAIDNSNNAFVTGTTTSTDAVANGFPANANGYQTASNGGAIQFFASKINTNGSGPSSMMYSTYFGGSTVPNGALLEADGGGIAVDTAGNLYITGGTNFIGGAQSPLFPMLNAQQSCLNQPGQKSGCSNSNGNLDAFVAKINPNQVGTAGLVYSTFLGGSGNDVGLAIAVDSSGNPYVTGETFSGDWNQPSSPIAFQSHYVANGDAFIAKLGPLNSGVYPIAYFTYLGGENEDIGRGIVVDSAQAAHVTGSTFSAQFPVTSDALKSCGTDGDAFVALISSTESPQPNGQPPLGDYVTCLGGSNKDEGTGIALDAFNATYVAGDTQSGNFPTVNPYQSGLLGTQDAFVSKITNLSSFSYVSGSPSVSPNPADTGNQVTFTFTWVNNGPEAANNVIFSGTLTGTGTGQGFTFNSATTSPGGSCPNPVNGVLTCTVGTVAAGSNLTVTVVLTPTSQTPPTTSLNVTPMLSANGNGFVGFACPINPCPLPVSVDDFTISASPASQTVTNGSSTSYTASLAPTGTGGTYTNSISMSASISPATSTITTSFTPTPVTISGGGPATSTLNVTTQPRPVGGASLWHRGPIYATWIPIGGLSLLGLGVGASRKRRRWIAGALLGLIASIVLLQGACGSSKSNAAATGGTPAGTYTITITGASGSASHQSTVTLVVN